MQIRKSLAAHPREYYVPVQLHQSLLALAGQEEYLRGYPFKHHIFP